MQTRNMSIARFSFVTRERTCSQVSSTYYKGNVGGLRSEIALNSDLISIGETGSISWLAQRIRTLPPMMRKLPQWVLQPVRQERDIPQDTETSVVSRHTKARGHMQREDPGNWDKFYKVPLKAERQII
jgi:hypothetical protein